MAIDKPSSKEEEFFAKQAAEQKKKLREKLDKDRDAVKKDQQKLAHWMKCPKCGNDLVEQKYKEIMIDACTECKGVWLDAGELELAAKSDTGNGLTGMFKKFVK